MYTRLFLVIILSLVRLTHVSGQKTPTFQVGVIGGLNAGNIKNTFGYHDILWRYNAGITVEKRILSNVLLASELIYSRQGNTINANSLSPKQIYTLDYVSLPIMLRVRPKNEVLFLEIGGQFGTLIYNHFNFDSTPDQGQPIHHTNIIDIGLTGGIGCRLGKHFVIDARYYHGMKSVEADYTTNNPQTGLPTFYRADRWYNRVYSINLSYYL